jgi:hypothetical protein
MRIAAWSLVSFALVGAAFHLPFARSTLRAAGGCPIPRATAAQVEAAQAGAFRGLRGTTLAPARPAVGFALGVTTRADAEAWARERGVECESGREGALLVCAAVPAPDGSGTYYEVAFEFRLRDLRLINLTTLRTGLDAGGAAALIRRLSATLEDTLGAPATEIRGDPGVIAYRYSDYLAEVSAMSLRGRGHAIREHYMSAPE